MRIPQDYTQARCVGQPARGGRARERLGTGVEPREVCYPEGMILATMRRTIRERALFERGGRVLVACSGGADSIALTHLLSRMAPELGILLFVASVDHGLRAEATEEVGLVERFARGLGLPFERITLALASGPGLQERAREARYRALLEHAREAGLHRVAVGHTLDDQAETVLARLLRGSGIAGLAGANPHRPDGVVRPLIDTRRAEIRAYIAHWSLPFIDDPSNDDPRYLRSRLRHTLLPLLAQEDPRLFEHLADLADDAREASSYLAARAEVLLQAALRPDGSLGLAALREAAQAPRRAALASWARCITGSALSRAQIEGIEGMLRGRGEVLLRAGWRVGVDSERIWASPQGPGQPIPGAPEILAAIRGLA